MRQFQKFDKRHLCILFLLHPNLIFMSSSEATQILNKARFQKVHATRMVIGQDKFAVSFGKFSGHQFSVYEAAQAYLLAWQIEQMK
jgi:predicted short-subunit dehydrogenase-like oxidoreductase (DUF2520 family)